MEHCIPLDRLSRQDLAAAGGKGANLGELLGAGYAVPPGFVVTTGAYRAAGTDPMTVPDDVAAAVREAYAALGSPPVAVRSSATAEDLPGAAFAGQQDTYLDVEGGDAVVVAVGDCWASLRSERAVAYRRERGIAEDDVAMAVVVQEMARPDWAGVLFTADPVTGARDRVLVDSVPGLGEAVVGGEVTPDHAVVDASGAVVERRAGERPGQGLPDDALAELARVGRGVAGHFGSPQDVEWVLTGGRVVLTQARPMTALPPPPVRLNRLQRLTGPVLLELFPRRPLPLELTAWVDGLLGRHLGQMFGEMGGMRIDVRAALPREDGVLQSFVPPVPRPTLRTPLRLARSAVRSLRHGAGDWRDDPRLPGLRRRADALAGPDLRDRPWSALTGAQAEAVDVLAELGDLRALYLPAAFRALAALGVAVRTVGRGRRVGDLLGGVATETTRANAALADLADAVRGDPGLRRLFAEHPARELVDAVASSPAATALRPRLAEILGRWGHRESSTILLLHEPTWGEDPSSVLGIVKALAGDAAAPAVAHDRPATAPDRPATAPARHATAPDRHGGTGTAGLPRTLRRLARAAAEGLAMREDTHLEITRSMPGVRRCFLEIGRRLAVHGHLDRAEDVWYLLRDEVASLPDPAARATAQDKAPYPDLRAVVERRRGAYAALAGSPLASPASLYPGRVERAGALVSGVAGGGSTATGPVRVLSGPEEFGSFRPGEVLVCAATSPPWTPLFARAAAVVVDHGGPASHAAIVAREYGLPVVLATGTATTALRTGQVVTVDGQRGLVVEA